MSNEQNSLYSQAFNFKSFIQDGVDNRTGQFTSSITLYEAPAEARNCPPLKLSLNFNPLMLSDVGLGKGWSFNLSSYQYHQSPNTESKRLHLSTGEHYQVREAGGLVVKDQKLKSFQFKRADPSFKLDNPDADFLVVYKSGLMEILSNNKGRLSEFVPIELRAANGRSLHLSWVRGDARPRLWRVQDGSRILLEIEYGYQVKVVRAPNTTESSTFTFVQRDSQLVKFVPPLGASHTWFFQYMTYGQITCLTSVRNSLGLVQQVRYDPRGHKLPPAKPSLPHHPQAIPCVAVYTVQPGSGQPPISTNYRYSENNFLGYGAFQDWNAGEDNLYRVREDYQYTTTVQVGGRGPKTVYTYNKFHLLVDTKYQKGTKQIHHTTQYHALRNTPFEFQPAQYLLPHMVKTTFSDAAPGQTHRSEESHYEFDEWGNSTSETKTNGIKTRRKYYPPEGEVDSDSGRVLCPMDPHNFQRYIKEEVVLPAQAVALYPAPSRTSRYTYLGMPTAEKGSFVVAQQLQTFENDENLTTSDYSHVNEPSSHHHGRLQRQIIHLSKQYPTTHEWAYRLTDDDELVETATRTSHDHRTIRDEITSSLLSGLTRVSQDAQGVQEHLSYDQIGRIVKVTASPGKTYEATETYVYAAGEGGDGYQLTVTDAKGIQTRYISDGLQRVIRVERQDDGDGDGHGPQSVKDIPDSSRVFRVVEERRYDDLGQCVSVDEIDWLSVDGQATEQRKRKTLEYDDWGKVSAWKITDKNGTLGVSVLSATDPIHLTHTQGNQGEGKTKTYMNNFGTTSRKQLLRPDGTVYGKIEYEYDGLGRLVKETDYFGHTSQYLVDGHNRVVQTTRPDKGTIKTQYAATSAAALPTSISVNGRIIGEQSFDGLERLVSQRLGTRTTKQIYQTSARKPGQVTTPKGDTHYLTYEPALDNALTSMKSAGTAKSYTYDKQSAAMLTLEAPPFKEQRQYSLSGRLVREVYQNHATNELSTESTFSIAGKLLSYSDVHGQKHEFHYDSFGRLQQLNQGKVKTTLTYDTSSRVSETSVRDEGTNRSLTTRRSYDDFSREIERTVSNEAGETLWRLKQDYNETSLILRRQMLDSTGVSLRDESYQYDSCNRLVQYHCEGTETPTNEKGHALQGQRFHFDPYNGFVKVSTKLRGDTRPNETSYTYSKDDPMQLIKITNTHPDYPRDIKLEYDKNGCLTRDEKGCKLEYDGENRLTLVRDAGGNIMSKYHYDAAGRLARQEAPGKPDTWLHYRGQRLVATTTGNSKVSYISDGKEYWGQITDTHGNSKDPEAQLWASDMNQSVLAWVDSQTPGRDLHRQQYTPYGFGVAESSTSIGFNGQWRDPVTGWYHLGSGYRVYNPVLMRFHSPDSWNPFTSGEINPYAYCSGDPINRVDPSGHASALEILRSVFLIVVSLITTVALWYFGPELELLEAYQIAAITAATDTVSTALAGIVWDAASNSQISLDSILEDAIPAFLGALSGSELLQNGYKRLLSLLTSRRGVSGTLELLEPVPLRTALKRASLANLPGETADNIALTSYRVLSSEELEHQSSSSLAHANRQGSRQVGEASIGDIQQGIQRGHAAAAAEADTTLRANLLQRMPAASSVTGSGAASGVPTIQSVVNGLLKQGGTTAATTSAAHQLSTGVAADAAGQGGGSGIMPLHFQKKLK